jgi:RNA polymerase sigma factor (sigma-70 family)
VRSAALMAAQPKARAAVDRDRNAEVLQRVLAESERQLRAHARRHAASPEDAEDALQSACLRFIERYHGDCEPLAWLHTTVKREAWALRRRASRRREVSLDAPASDVDDQRPRAEALPSDAPEPHELAVRAAAVVNRGQLIAELKPDERTALLLFGLGYSYEEIGRTRGWSYTKVNRCIAEGRAAVRRRLMKG